VGDVQFSRGGGQAEVARRGVERLQRIQGWKPLHGVVPL
jgi:hypothetical protein